ncbi:peptidase S13 D-Ala-D-Ala carboxypeptidase C [Cyanobacterium stanieri PCC 7202]|uniref:Peptidase S13 D-Ala-D-Ala carboxypeptidase C n=1 Tax=Cyanobacterium stanieri (strain ATCC 29140 / PCC 7202) TaxID=292563 RepID=K9YK64_CYASC|nr:peptidase S13 D-Ala-D-Ala carboxypeptidase C [Cyanobacterium stanieri PCC 7202]
MFFSTLLTIFSGWFNFALTPQEVPLIPWHENPIFQLPTEGDEEVERILEQYLEGLANRNVPINQQGVWIQTHWATLGDNRGTIPAPAASITKVATTLGALDKWSVDHRFLTNIYTTGDILGGVLQGDLIVEAGNDPFFVWEDAIALGDEIRKLGIERVRGNLIIVGDWQMNFKENNLTSGDDLRRALNSDNWNYTVETQYQGMENPPPRPQLVIEGENIFRDGLPPASNLLYTHSSKPLHQILRAMNLYSNNFIADHLAQQIGGGDQLGAIASKLSNVPPEEIQLINGSGLGVDNRISPRAACRMLIAIEQKIANHNITIADLFPVSGIDEGTLKERNIPFGVPVKTGSLAVVSALSGVIDTEERETVYFAIMNYANGLDDLRNRQDQLLTDLDNHWQTRPILPMP